MASQEEQWRRFQDGDGSTTIPGKIRVFEDVSQYDMPSTKTAEISAKYTNLMKFMNEAAYRSAGFGSYYNQLQTAMVTLNRFGPNILAPNMVRPGAIFITRPQLNLSAANIARNRILSILDTMTPNDVNFAIRALLDPRWVRGLDSERVAASSLFNPRSPWLTPVCNGVVSITGWPDLTIDVTRTEGGFFNESLAFVNGSARMKQGADLSLTVNDFYGNILLTIFHLWCEFEAAVVKNEIVAYPEEIDRRRLCYTVSIYRFILEPDKQHILGWAKATGCFPISVPLGALFNINEREQFVTSANKFTIPMIANVVEYNDPIIPFEFNTLAKRYWQDIDMPERAGSFAGSTVKDVPILGYDGSLDLNYNRIGLPWIENGPTGKRLVYRYIPSPDVDQSLYDPGSYFQQTVADLEFYEEEARRRGTYRDPRILLDEPLRKIDLNYDYSDLTRRLDQSGDGFILT